MKRYGFVTLHESKTMSSANTYPDLQLVPPGQILDRLLDGISRGVKTATSALEVSFDMRGEKLPQAGDRYTLLDSNNSPAGNIEVTEVRILPFSEVGIDVATAEGDWFRTVQEWREAHERFFNRSAEQVAEYLGLTSWQAEDDTSVVVRFFRVL